MHWAIVTVYFHAFGGGYPARGKLGVTPGQSGMGEGGGGVGSEAAQGPSLTLERGMKITIRLEQALNLAWNVPGHKFMLSGVESRRSSCIVPYYEI